MSSARLHAKYSFFASGTLMFRADVKFLCIYTKNILNFVVSVPPNQVRESPQKGRHEFFFCGCVVQRAVVCVFTQPPVKNSHSYNRLVWANWWAAGHIPPKTTCNQARAIVYQSVLHTYLFYLPRRFFKNVILSFLPLYVQVRNLGLRPAVVTFSWFSS